MKLDKKIYKVFLLIIVSAFTLSAPAQGAMSDYCVTPPFLAQNIPPNVLIVLDNSGSMCGQAYAGSYNPDQFVNKQYYGYFDGSKNYRYSGVAWVETAAAMTTGTVANPIANGSFLNWATMRRVEVAKKLLIGGESVPTSWLGTASVSLNGDTCSGWNFQKDYDTSTSAVDLIYPFDGNYRFTRSGLDLNVTPLAALTYTERRYPSITGGDVANGAWTPNSGTTRWSQVDEATADDDITYIQNTTSNTDDQVILGNDKSAFGIAGTITSVSVVVRARKATTGTMRIQGVLRVKGASADVDSTSSYSNLSTSYDTYQFSWATNPQNCPLLVCQPWTFDDLTTSAVGSLTGFGVKAYTGPSSSQYPRVTQIYLLVTVSNPSGGPYKMKIDLSNVNATGIINTLTGDVKFGLAYYAGSDEGARIATDINFLTPVSMVNSIAGMRPSGWTPLGESLYEMTRYFRQDAPYYNNSPADYSTGLSYDPYWYNFTDASITDRYVPCAKSFILFLTDGESTQDQNMQGTATSSPYSACTLTNIKACSGFGIPDANGSIAGVQRFAGTTIGTTYASYGTDYIIDVAYWARTNDMRPGTCTTVNTVFDQCIPGNQNISLYSVFMFGKGSTLLKDAAIYGGFNDLNANNKPDCATSPAECYKDSNGDGIISPTAGVCSNSISTVCTSDANCTSPGICKFDDPITYYEGEDGYELQDSILRAISDILRRVTSGTAASVLASGEGSGANLIQATYYPKRMFGSDEVSWIGAMQNLWYYVDPFFANSNIREEGGTPKDGILNLKADTSSQANMDYILQLYFDTTEQKARARRIEDLLGDGVAGTQLPTIDFENLGNLWNAGTLLWSRNLSSAPRTIKTWIDKDSDGVFDAGEYVDFSTTAFNALSAGDKTVLRTSLQAADDTEALKTISYIHGYDKFCTGTATPCAADSDCISPVTCSGSGYRARIAAVDLNGDGDAVDLGESPKVWKLGDIINSTPQIASWPQLNGYDQQYADSSYKDFVNDTGLTLPVTSTARYKNRGMVFVGANDGMLHAFKLGKLGLKWTSQTSTQKATLGKYCAASPSTACYISTDCPSGDTCTSDTDLGKEVWAFIPKNVLPYLKYTYDPSYCHIYSVDLAPFVFDASIEGPASACGTATSNYWDCAKNAASWRTILVGGMRYGGGCKDPTTYAGAATAGVKVPVTGQGYSSYFALDITDPYNPQLLWEFSSPELGFATAGAAIVRIGARTAGATSSTADNPTTTNGRWFVVLGSGPTGGIDTADKQFLGSSDQELKLFVLDLKTGLLARPAIQTGIFNAFAGSIMRNSTQDSDLDYQNDVVYIPYVRKCALGDTAAICDSAAGKWNNGGVLRLLTNEDLAGNTVGSSGGTALNPANWVVSRVIDDAGPVTSSVVSLQSKKTGKLWLYFGSGRYFYKLSTVLDDADKVRNLYGLKDPCFNGGAFLASCLAGTGASFTPGELANVNLATSGVTDTVDDQGWKISLDDCTTSAGAPVACSSAYFRTERVVSDSSASTSGLVFFTTLTPFDDICSSGGDTAIWAVKYDTGGAGGTLLQGKILMQTATGAIEQVDMPTAFTEKSGRKTKHMPGAPPTGDPPIMEPPTPVKRVLHMRER